MYSSKQRMTQEALKDYLDKLFNYETRLELKSWSAEVLGLCRPVPVENFYTYSAEIDTRLESEFSINLNKRLLNTEILDLLIISYYLPPDGQFVLQEAIRNSERKKHLHKDIVYRLYSSGQTYSFLYLLNSTIQIRSFNGQIRRTLRKVLGDRNSIISYSESSIFQLPFWYTPTKDNVERFSGWVKHVKDHGTLRPESYFQDNHKDDKFWQEENFKKQQESYQRFEDTLSFILGFIS